MVNDLKVSDYKEKFTIYQVEIQTRVNEADMKRTLFKKAAIALCKYLSIFEQTDKAVLGCFSSSNLEKFTWRQ